MWISVVLWAACSGREPEPITPECTDTWEGWAEGFLRTWCTSCHSSGLALGQRYGAPLGVDFDTYEGVVAHADRILATATGVEPRMPPVGVASLSERERLEAWLACGMPGEASQLERGCGDAPEVIEQDLAIASPGDAEALCPESDRAVHLRGDLTVASGAVLDCLCEVDGAVVLAGGDAVELDRLAKIGGDLVASGAPLRSVALSGLESVGGEIVFEDLAQLDEVRLPWLVTVGGDLRITRLAIADRVDLSRLESVGGSLELSQIPGFRALLGEGYALQQIGGELVLSDLDAWFGFYGFANLDQIGGALRFVDNDRISALSGFTLLQQVEGIEVSANDNLQALDGFDTLATLGGDLQIAGNPSLIREEAFAALREVSGTIEVRDNPALARLQGLEGVTSAGALLLADNAGLDELRPWALEQVEGDVIVADNAGLVSAAVFPSLVQVGGTLQIVGSDQLEVLSGLDVLGALGGDLALEDLPSLASLPSIAQLPAVGGTVRIVGSGLPGLGGLEALSVIGGLQLSSNNALSDLSALHGLSHVQGDLRITDNEALQPAEAQVLVDAIETIDGTVLVEDNGDHDDDHRR